ncbi:MAG: Do family serine endopeptidase [Bradyrhizobium sp.]|jgi:serine protease Do|uniref:Do family serine endopeptidase n=1 Tax=Bradyrhizobium sp. TaxID=376 RepID=UPI003C7E629D
MTGSHGQHRKFFAGRRLALLGSVAVLGSALAFGPMGYGHFTESAHAATTSQTTQQGPNGFADLVSKVKPAVISVRVQLDETPDVSMLSRNGENEDMPNDFRGTPFERFFQQFGEGNGQQMQHQRHQLITGVGSGFFISADGYAVTNNHVVDHAKTVQVTTDDGKTYTAKVIGTDPKTDLALIKVEGGSDFTFVNLETQRPRIGDWVVAVGNPYGLGGTVTAGIISAEGRDIGSGPYDNYLQIDAPINKGNSGGPTFDTNGNVVGVNTAIYSPSGGSIGIGFDIPAATVKNVIAQLKDKGVVTRGWLGVQVQPVSAGIAESLGLKNASGALVDEAKPDTPAAKAGIQAGDVITAVNGNTIKDSRALAREISGMGPGSSAKLDILRKGEQKTITVTLATMPGEHQKQANADTGSEDNGSVPGVPHLGLSVAPASEVAGAGAKGVVITGVDPEGPAAEHGLQSGDVILDVAGQSVGSVSELRSALSDAKSGGKHDVLMRVKSANNTHYVAVPIG